MDLLGSNFVLTYSGRKIDLTNLQPGDVTLSDVARSLSLTCRWCGHLGVHYSVAQHSVLLTSYAMSLRDTAYHDRIELAKICLLHDASEAYLSDISFGVKHMLPDYMALEEKVQGAIYHKYLGYLPTESQERDMKQLDHRLAVSEYLDIKPGAKQSDLGEPHCNLERLPLFVRPIPAMNAEAQFLSLAKSLGMKRTAEITHG